MKTETKLKINQMVRQFQDQRAKYEQMKITSIGSRLSAKEKVFLDDFDCWRKDVLTPVLDGFERRLILHGYAAVDANSLDTNRAGILLEPKVTFRFNPRGIDSNEYMDEKHGTRILPHIIFQGIYSKREIGISTYIPIPQCRRIERWDKKYGLKEMGSEVIEKELFQFLFPILASEWTLEVTTENF